MGDIMGGEWRWVESLKFSVCDPNSVIYCFTDCRNEGTTAAGVGACSYAHLAIVDTSYMTTEFLICCIKCKILELEKDGLNLKIEKKQCHVLIQ